MEILSGPSEGIRSILFTVILLWSVFWKGLSLWNAARNKQGYWFVALLIINTVGILEIAYLTFFKKDKNNKNSSRNIKK